MCPSALSLRSELRCKWAILSELLVEPVVHMHPKPVEDAHMVSEQMEDGEWGYGIEYNKQSSPRL